MKALKRFLKRFENEMAAAAFAEAGERETALKILKDGPVQNRHDHNNIGDPIPSPAAGE